jgi:hypothetical protein
MKPELEAERGLLRVGLYAPRQGVADLAGRFAQAAERGAPWQNQVWPPNPEVDAVASGASALLDSIGYSVRYLAGDSAGIQPKLHLKANFVASPLAWEKLWTSPHLPGLLRKYIVYLAQQSTAAANAERKPDVQAIPDELRDKWLHLVQELLKETAPQDHDRMLYYFTVGSVNLDFRSMVMDGEVMILMSGWQSVTGFLDFLLLPGLCHWAETTEELDRHLDPPGSLLRGLAGFMKLSL